MTLLVENIFQKQRFSGKKVYYMALLYVYVSLFL